MKPTAIPCSQDGASSPARSLPEIFHRHRGWLGALASCLLTLPAATAAPYPADGHLTHWQQPDGKQLEVRVFGDEFYGRASTSSGHSVIFNSADQTYYYAQLGEDGRFVSTGVPAQQAPPAALPRHLKESQSVVRAARDQKVRQFAPDRSARWNARVHATQQREGRNGQNQAIIQPADASSPSAEGAAPAPAATNAAAAPVEGNRVGLMILAQFPNDPNTAAADPVNFPATHAKMVRYANAVGYTDDGNTGSIRDYYFAQSVGKMTFTQDMPAIITLPQPRNFYNFADYPTNQRMRDAGEAGRAMVNDAITILRNANFDFSNLSVDGNQNVLATSVLFAGPDSGVWAQGLWPHSWQVPPINVGTANNPRFIRAYQVTNVPDAAPSIGTNCHELGHMLLDYPDFYDYEGDSEGVGNHSLMGGGNWLNDGRTPAPIDLYLKYQSGWADLTELEPTASATVNLPSTGNRGCRIIKPGTDTEYFLVENRGDGDPWAAHTEDKGIIIWHCDENVAGNDRQEMTPTAHYELSVEQADGEFDLENGANRGDSRDYFDNATGVFNDGTQPDAMWWEGKASGLSIGVLSAPGAEMTVRFGSDPPTLVISPPVAQFPEGGGDDGEFNLITDNTWTWTCDSDWVKTDETITQTGEQTFTYSVEPNPGVAARRATISINAAGLISTHTINQTGIGGDDYGNTMANAFLIAPTSITRGTLEKPGDLDYFKIVVPGSGTLTIYTEGSTDTSGTLLNRSGQAMRADDDTGDEKNFRIETAITAGVYYVELKHFLSSGTGSYKMFCEFSGNDDHGNVPDHATLIGEQSATAGKIESGGDVDCFRIDVSRNCTLMLSSNGVTDTYGTLLDAAGATLTYDDDSGDDQNFKLKRTVPPGSYYIQVRHSNSTGTGEYELVSTIEFPDDYGNQIANATLIGQESVTDGNIEFGGDRDVFRIDVVARGALLLETLGQTDILVTLYDARGNYLASDDDSGEGGNVRLSYPIMTLGTYYVEIRHWYETGTGSYRLSSRLLPQTIRPDLQSEGIAGVLPANVASGAPIQITGNVQNTGTAPSDSYRIRYYLSTDTTVTPSDCLLGEREMQPLAAGAIELMDTPPLIVPLALPSGTYYAGWIIDPTGLVSESDEKNNSGCVGTTPVKVTHTTSTVSSLSQLALGSGAVLNPGFSPGVLNYASTVRNAEGSVLVVPTTTDALATLRINGNAALSGVANGPIPLVAGNNTLTIVVRAENGSTTTYTVAVNYERLNKAPAIVTHPSAGTLNPGQSTELQVVATGSAPMNYQWYVGSPGDINEAIGSNAPALTVSPLVTTSYWVKVSNAMGSANSVAATVTVNQPVSIVTQPVGSTINPGSTATLSVVAAGTATIHYQWYQGGVGDTSIPVGTDAPAFTTPALTNDTDYWVRITNVASPAGVDSASATVAVNQALVIVNQPASQEPPSESQATLNVEVTGTGPIHYQWYEGAQGDTSRPVGDNSASFTTPPLIIDHRYWVRIENPVGSVDSESAVLSVRGPRLWVGNQVAYDFGSLANPGDTFALVGKLPSGLAFNRLTGLLSGTVTGAPGIYPLTIQVLRYNYVMRSTSFVISIQEFPSVLIGSYEYLLEDEDSKPQGILKLSITKTNTWSATLEMAGAAKRSAKGTFILGQGRRPAAPIVATFAAAGSAPAVTLHTTIEAGAMGVSGQFANGTMRGFRMARAFENPADDTPCVLVLDAGEQDGIQSPAGIGWARGIISKSGFGTLKGSLGDGSAVTIPLRLSVTGQALIWAQPYPNKQSFIAGVVTLPTMAMTKTRGDFETLEDGVWWTKAADPASLSYPLGFGPIEVAVGAAKWTLPASAPALGASLGWENDASCEVEIMGAGLSNEDPQLTQPALPTVFTMDAGFNLMASAPVGLARVPWHGKVNRADGTFKGVMQLPAGFVPNSPAAPAAVSGVLIQDERWGEVSGCGLIKVPAEGPRGSFRTAPVILKQ